MTPKKSSVKIVVIDEDRAGQRLDNFLTSQLKNVPKSRIYQMLRKGEVRVNKGRKDASYKLNTGDSIRIPPYFMEEPEKQMIHLERFQPLLTSVLYEDDFLMVLNKPSGIAVHAGTNDTIGIVEALRQLRNELTFIELAHRIDKETSGCLLLAKKRQTLKKLHLLFREGHMNKQYLALTLGQWRENEKLIIAPLNKFNWQDGERKVNVSDDGKPATTKIEILNTFPQMSLIKAIPETGRMHQIRVHCALMGHPIAGDQKYGNKDFNQYTHRLGLKRLFLHAASLSLVHPDTQEKLTFTAPLPKELEKISHLK